MTCFICNNFRGKWKINSLAESHERRGSRHHIVPQFTWDEMKFSAKSCFSCRILESGCRACFDRHGIRESDILRGSVQFFYPPHVEAVDELNADKHLSFLLTNGRWFVVELFVVEGDDCPVPDLWDYFPISERTSPRTDSAMALVTIKSWISECIVTHYTPEGLCESPERPYLPTRVVDVGLSDGVVRLVEPQGARDRYICLSHCWGLSQIITTTRSTFEERKKGIAWEDLSKTFQDAISLTRTLGFNYIWIDSLCIVQDDSLDWQIESAKMASVYSNGHLTIAATHSDNGCGGLFSRTEDVRLAGKTPDGENYCLYFREKIDHHVDMGNEIDIPDIRMAGFNPTATYYPLLTRAWVYQERMLSTRVLHFGRYEMFFECKSAIRCECGSIQFHGYSGSESQVPLIKVEYADTLGNYRDGNQERIDAKIHYHCARMWRTMVSCYTSLFLTKSKDRLPAISGLAKQLSTGRKSKYLAGLWEESLHDDLLWIVYATSAAKKPRPYPRNAPTWSWASVETTVLYYDVILFTDLEESGYEERTPCEHFSVVEKCEVSWPATDEFGLITHGSLMISGLVAKGILERDVELQDGLESIVHYVSFPNTRLPMRTDYLLSHDSRGQTEPLSSVFCLRMSLVLHPKRESLVSLVLKISPECHACYERIGTLEISGSIGSVGSTGEVFRTAELRTVVII